MRSYGHENDNPKQNTSQHQRLPNEILNDKDIDQKMEIIQASTKGGGGSRQQNQNKRISDKVT